MSDPAHSPEPWAYIPDKVHWLEDANGHHIGDIDPDQTWEDTRRIIACVNFCVRIKTEYLEKHSAFPEHFIFNKAE